LNEYLPPQEFHSLVLFEDEHPLQERESQKGERNIIVYHSAGEQLKPLKEIKSDLDQKIYSMTLFEAPEQEDWEQMYQKIL